jgi:Rrf2 family transcriptional regulator, iron-sulfur cluster assembly transcription factor
MNFSKTSAYALKILSFMADSEKTKFSAIYLHKKLHIPHPYMRQLLTSLSKRGFIKSTRGRKGGFEFSRDIHSIYIADVIDAVEGLDVFNTCIVGFESCPFDHSCPLHNTWTKTRENIIGVLQKTALSDFKKIP